MFNEFKGKGHYVTKNSADIGNILAQVGCYEWLINMVRTAQTNCTGAAVKEEAKKLKIGMYESIRFQHKKMPLCFAVWADNNLVKMLFNFDHLTILKADDGVLIRKCGSRGKQDM